MKYLITVVTILLISSCSEKDSCVCKIQSQFPKMKVYPISNWNYILYDDSCNVFNYKPGLRACEGNEYKLIRIK